MKNKNQIIFFSVIVIGVLIYFFLKFKSDKGKMELSQKNKRSDTKDAILAIKLQQQLEATRYENQVRAQQWKFIQGDGT